MEGEYYADCAKKLRIMESSNLDQSPKSRSFQHAYASASVCLIMYFQTNIVSEDGATWMSSTETKGKFILLPTGF